VHFPLWIVGNFATVEEVKNGLKNIVVVDNISEGVNAFLPLHYRVTDPTGAEIIIEYVKSGLKIYDNPMGVVTNSPEFDWHLTNVANYTNLSATNVPKAELPGLQLVNTSQGTGMRGLPGDYTPPSRFIRALAIQESALPVETAEEGVNLSWHIINNIDIPIGATRDKDENGNDFLNRTQWVNVSDLKNLKLYLRTYDNQMIRVIDMQKIGLGSPDVKAISINGKPEYIDISNNQN
jgi:choloylglycine hydrolase